MKKLSSVSLVSWALNEEENVEEFLIKAQIFCSSIAEKFEIVIVDDGSTDKTVQLIQQASMKNSMIVFSSNGSNLGVGYSMKKAILMAQMDYVIWQTQDWSYDLTSFTENIHQLENFDILHGARKLSIIGRSDNMYKAFISLVNYLVIKFFSKAPFSDFQNVTLYPREVVDSFTLVSNSSFTSPELLLRSWLSGYSFLEIPVQFIPRTNGEAKGTSFRSILKSILEIFEFRVKYWANVKESSQSRGFVSKIK